MSILDLTTMPFPLKSPSVAPTNSRICARSAESQRNILDQPLAPASHECWAIATSGRRPRTTAVRQDLRGTRSVPLSLTTPARTHLLHSTPSRTRIV